MRICTFLLYLFIEKDPINLFIPANVVTTILPHIFVVKESQYVSLLTFYFKQS